MYSVNEPTWSKDLKRHTCCGSTHSYHKTHCKIGKTRGIPGRGSDPILEHVQVLKNEGMKSTDIARELKIPLSQVNDLWLL